MLFLTKKVKAINISNNLSHMKNLKNLINLYNNNPLSSYCNLFWLNNEITLQYFNGIYVDWVYDDEIEDEIEIWSLCNDPFSDELNTLL